VCNVLEQVNTAPLEVKDLRFSYGPTRAVDGVSLEVRAGEIFGLLGPNGAGKTTTLSAIEGLLEPDSGSVTIDGIDRHANPPAAKARIGVQLQSTGFQSELTIAQITRLYAALYGVAMSRQGSREVLHSMGLENEASKRFCQLSAGSRNACRWLSRRSMIPRSCSSTSRPPVSTRRLGASCGTGSRRCASAVAACS